MSLVKRIGLLLVLGCLSNSLLAKDDRPEPSQLYIGITHNRLPYSLHAEKQAPTGLVVQQLTKICKQMNAQCHFVAARFNKLQQELQTFQLNAVLVLDDVPLMDTSTVTLTLSPPLCDITPVFIQRYHTQPGKQLKHFENRIIGVLENSVFHHFIADLDQERFKLKFKLYPILESGIMDLITQRIDALLTDAAFYQERVASTVLAKPGSDHQLIATQAQHIELPNTSMRLMTRAKDQALSAAFKKTIATIIPSQTCESLLAQPASRPNTLGTSN